MRGLQSCSCRRATCATGAALPAALPAARWPWLGHSKATAWCQATCHGRHYEPQRWASTTRCAAAAAAETAVSSSAVKPPKPRSRRQRSKQAAPSEQQQGRSKRTVPIEQQQGRSKQAGSSGQQQELHVTPSEAQQRRHQEQPEQQQQHRGRRRAATEEQRRPPRPQPETLAELLDAAQHRCAELLGSGTFTPAAAAAAALLTVGKGLRLVGGDASGARTDTRFQAWASAAASGAATGQVGAGDAAGMVWALATTGCQVDGAALQAVVSLVEKEAGSGLLTEAAAAEARARLSWALLRLGRMLDAAERLHGGLPWQVLPRCLPDVGIQELLEEVELRQDMITLADGREVQESRQTCWQSDAGHSFAYSGKVMAGGALTPRVAAIRDRLAHLLGVRYDSVLINYYKDGKSGMRYHSDPLTEGGIAVWDSDTAVVSLGAPREFVFRTALTQQQQPGQQPVHYPYLVENGDVVRMVADCQERYQHCIKVEREATHASPRMSLVFKLRQRGS